jgi:hypothetical protein
MALRRRVYPAVMGIHRLIIAGLLVLGGCGNDGEKTGQSCEVADDCYPGVDHEDLSGEVACLDRVAGGYCTHECVTDEDCCAVPGECATDAPQVCAPFESTGIYRCFLSCEASVIGDQEGNDYCGEFAHRDFICRATGGGDPKKVCVP